MELRQTGSAGTKYRNNIYDRGGEMSRYQKYILCYTTVLQISRKTELMFYNVSLLVSILKIYLFAFI